MNCPEENYFHEAQNQPSNPSQENSQSPNPKPDSNPQDTSRTDEFYNPDSISRLSDSDAKFNKDARDKIEETFLVEMELMIGEYLLPF